MVVGKRPAADGRMLMEASLVRPTTAKGVTVAKIGPRNAGLSAYIYIYSLNVSLWADCAWPFAPRIWGVKVG